MAAFSSLSCSSISNLMASSSKASLVIKMRRVCVLVTLTTWPWIGDKCKKDVSYGWPGKFTCLCPGTPQTSPWSPQQNSSCLKNWWCQQIWWTQFHSFCDGLWSWVLKRLEATVGKQCALTGNVEVGATHWVGWGAVVMRVLGLAGRWCCCRTEFKQRNPISCLQDTDELQRMTCTMQIFGHESLISICIHVLIQELLFGTFS